MNNSRGTVASIFALIFTAILGITITILDTPPLREIKNSVIFAVKETQNIIKDISGSNCVELMPHIQTALFPRTEFFVEPYIVYPKDKSEIPEYKDAVKKYMEELQGWYLCKAGVTFVMKDVQVVHSKRSYLQMRCGESPVEKCLKNQVEMKGNWAQYMNEAIHGGEAIYEKEPGWDANTVDLMFGVGGGGYAGANSNGSTSGWAVVGDWSLEPISKVKNSWGIPCDLSDGWQCKNNVARGTPAHELGHAFGLPHPGEEYKDDSVMEWHGNYPKKGFLDSEIQFLQNSPFFK